MESSKSYKIRKGEYEFEITLDKIGDVIVYSKLELGSQAWEWRRSFDTQVEADACLTTLHGILRSSDESKMDFSKRLYDISIVERAGQDRMEIVRVEVKFYRLVKMEKVEVF